MQSEKDGTVDTCTGRHLGHRAGLGFAASRSLDLKLAPAEDFEPLNRVEPNNMKVHKEAGLKDGRGNDQAYIERCNFRHPRVNWVNLQ